MRISDWSSDVCASDRIGGLIGSVLTAVTMLPALGGPGGADYALGGQLWIQAKSVAVAVPWSAVGSSIAFSIAKAVPGGRGSEDRRVGKECVRACTSRMSL